MKRATQQTLVAFTAALLLAPLAALHACRLTASVSSQRRIKSTLSRDS